MNIADSDEMFETIYATDLVYAPDCWKLCGDAHCCNYSRYKSKLVTIGRHPQELPLLPGEYEFLRRKGWLDRFPGTTHRVIQYPLGQGVMQLEFIVGSNGSCACEHATRTTTCRLYPLTPLFDIDGRVTGVETDFGIYEELEKLDALPRACKVESVPFTELGKFLSIAAAIGRNPVALFYLTAYQVAKAHAVERLWRARAAQPATVTVDAFRLFEGLFALQRLFDQSELRPRLETMAAEFRRRYGARFQLDAVVSEVQNPSDASFQCS